MTGTITDAQVWRAAGFMLKKYGENAEVVAAEFAHELANRGDSGLTCDAAWHDAGPILPSPRIGVVSTEISMLRGGYECYDCRNPSVLLTERPCRSRRSDRFRCDDDRSIGAERRLSRWVWKLVHQDRRASRTY